MILHNTVIDVLGVLFATQYNNKLLLLHLQRELFLIFSKNNLVFSWVEFCVTKCTVT